MKCISDMFGKLFYYYPEKLVNKLGHMYYQSQIQGEIDTLHLKGRMRIQWPDRLEVGKNCCINDGCLMQCQGGVTLGDNVTISTGAIVLARQYRMSDWSEQCLKDEPEMDHEEKSVLLNDHTWIGAEQSFYQVSKLEGKV